MIYLCLDINLSLIELLEGKLQTNHVHRYRGDKLYRKGTGISATINKYY